MFILKYFFGVLKESEVSSALRFVFIAGVSKFSRVSIFSELNNLTDITIKDFKGYTYSFRYPNQEVKISFLKFLLFSHIPANAPEQILFIGLADYLNDENYDGFFETVSAIFASIPYTLESKRDEAYFFTPRFSSSSVRRGSTLAARC